jgi:hypothetical protein
MTNIIDVTYGQTGESKKTNNFGMRDMQAKAYEARNEQYLLLKAPPASGKSRALMFIALDKLYYQNIAKVIVAVPERSIGGSFEKTDLKSNGFFASWEPNPQYNLCTPGGEKSKVEAFKKFMNSNEKILNLEKVEPLELIDNVIKEHNREIKQKKISVTINRNQNDWPSCFVDKNKLYNALSIFIENAVHYNKKMGQIIIDSKINGDNLCIQIIDNGHGLTRDEVNKLNLNHFYRSEIAKEYNPNGMGVGINVGRAIIIAHHGSLKIDSLGPCAGVTIEINIPLNFINSLPIE